MSYILDALARSEREARGLTSAVLEPSAPTATTRPNAWLMALGVLLIANLAGIWWLFGDRADRANNETAINNTTTMREASPDLPPSIPLDHTPSGVASVTTFEVTAYSDADRRASDNASSAPGTVTITPDLAGRRTSSQPARPSAVPIGSLPAAVRQQIPDLTFSSHIFASDPDLRTVMINGQRFREGDTLARGITLLQITEDGAVLAYLHYVFEIGVLQDWAAP